MFGDSRAAYGSSNLRGSTPPGLVIRDLNTGFQSWIAAMTGNKLIAGRWSNFGEQGNTTANMLAIPRVTTGNPPVVTPGYGWRPNTGASANKGTDYAIAHTAGIVGVIAGTNNTTSLAVSQAEFAEIVHRHIAGGKVVLAFNEMPRGIRRDGTSDASSFLVANDADRIAFSQWIDKLDCQSGDPLAIPGVYVVNSRDAMWDPVYKAQGLWRNIVGVTFDGIHPSQYGAMVCAKAVHDRLKTVPWYQALQPRHVLPTTNGLTVANSQYPYLNINPNMAPGAAGLLGGAFPAPAPATTSVPEGWRLVQNGVTQGGTALPISIQKGLVDQDVGNYCRIAVSGTQTTAKALQTVILRGNAVDMAADFTAGRITMADYIRGFSWIYVEPGSRGIQAIQLVITMYVPGSSQAFLSSYSMGIGTTRSMVCDVDRLDAGGMWIPVLGPLLKLSDELQATENNGPGLPTQYTGAQIEIQLILGNDQVSDPQTIDAAVRIGGSGICVVRGPQLP